MGSKKSSETAMAEARQAAGKQRTIFDPATMWDGKGYNDSEINNQPSMTDPSGYVPTTEMIGRILKGEKVPQGNFGRYDIDSKNNESSEDLIEKFSDPTDVPGFDLSDLPELQKQERELKARIKAIKVKKENEIRKQKEDKLKESNQNIDRGIDRPSDTTVSDGRNTQN